MQKVSSQPPFVVVKVVNMVGAKIAASGYMTGATVLMGGPIKQSVPKVPAAVRSFGQPERGFQSREGSCGREAKSLRILAQESRAWACFVAAGRCWGRPFAEASGAASKRAHSAAVAASAAVSGP